MREAFTRATYDPRAAHVARGAVAALLRPPAPELDALGPELAAIRRELGRIGRELERLQERASVGGILRGLARAAVKRLSDRVLAALA